jgi:hypothetical protein
MTHNIRKSILVLGFALVALLATTVPASAQARYTLAVENSSNYRSTTSGFRPATSGTGALTSSRTGC